MSLPTLTFEEANHLQQQQMQASAGVVIDFSIGSIMAAFTESNGSLFIFLQALASKLLTLTRLSTSTGQDVDAFIEQFGFTRYEGNPSSGNVTFSRNVTTIVASIPIGAIVSVSSENNLNFIVTLDTTNPNYNPETNTYDIPIDTASITAPVTCQSNGMVGNVLPNQINTIDSQLVGVDFVTNDDAFTNGVDQWSDEQTRLEFALYINGLSRATRGAIDFAVSTTPAPPAIYRYNIVENETYEGADDFGYFFVVVDDGTGVTNETLISNVSAQVEKYRGLCIRYSVIGPTRVDVDVSMTITLVNNPSEEQDLITQKIQSAIINYINTLSFNSLLPYTRFAEIIYDSDENILNVTDILVNGGTSDITTDNLQLLFAGDITVNYTS